MNNCIFTGRLTKEPEAKSFESGKEKVSFTLAVDKEYKKGEADFIPCVAWGDLGKNISKFLGKGSLVCVRGSLEVRTYEKDGEKRYIYEINTQKVDFLDKIKKEEEKPAAPPIEEEAYYQPSIDEDDASMLPFSLE